MTDQEQNQDEFQKNLRDELKKRVKLEEAFRKLKEFLESVNENA